MSDVNNTHLGMSHVGDVSLSLIELSEAYWLFRKHERAKVLFKNSKTTLLRRYNLFKLLFQALNKFRYCNQIILRFYVATFVRF